jgi:hypothetical protein
VIATAETLWLRAVRAAEARGLLPANRSRLTPKELAAEVTRRGDDRLNRLVEGWYYPASYGRIHGALSDEEAIRIIAALEAEVARTEIGRPQTRPHAVEKRRPQGKAECELCGVPLMGSRS